MDGVAFDNDVEVEGGQVEQDVAHAATHKVGREAEQGGLCVYLAQQGLVQDGQAGEHGSIIAFLGFFAYNSAHEPEPVPFPALANLLVWIGSF